MGRIVVVGASGNVGTAVLRRLAEEPDTEVVGVARRIPPREGPYAPVRWLPVDLAEPTCEAVLRAAMADTDAVVHAGWALQPSHAPDYLARVNIEGTARVARAAAAAKVGTLVYLSSVGAYAPGPKTRAVDESWPTTGVRPSHYSRHKAAVERMLDRFEARHPGPRVVRLRPGLIFQRDAASEIVRYFLGPLAPVGLLRHGGLPVLPLSPAMAFQVVHTDDVADAVIRSIHGSVRGPYNLATEPVITPRLLAAHLGGRLLPVPPVVLRGVAAATFALRLQPTEPGWIDLAAAVPVLSTARAAAHLGWRPSRNAEDTLDELLAAAAHGSGVRPGGPTLRGRDTVGARVRGLAAGHLPGAPATRPGR